MRGLPGPGRQGWRERPAGRRRADQKYGIGENDCELLALCDNALRLHSPRHAMAAAEITHQRRSLCTDCVHSVAEQNRWRKRCDECPNPPQGADAEPGGIHHPVSRENSLRGKVISLLPPWKERTQPALRG